MSSLTLLFIVMREAGRLEISNPELFTLFIFEVAAFLVGEWLWTKPDNSTE